MSENRHLAAAVRGKTAAAEYAELRIAAVGTSAGGLDALRSFVAAIPPDTGVAYIFVQHLDPTHPSLLVELLAGHTRIPVSDAIDGAVIHSGHIYVLPPRTLASVTADRMHLTAAPSKHGARFPFDVLLTSLAESYGPHSAAVTLTGTGSDGALGSEKLKAKGGLIIVQTPEDAEHDGMPRSVIETGCADLIMSIEDMPRALTAHWSSVPSSLNPQATTADEQAVLDLVRSRTEIDFRLYKPGTICRRIERRMGLSGLLNDDFAAYLDRLLSDDAELQRLTSDLLINVTSFFRDPEVFQSISVTVAPDIVAARNGSGPIRIWVAGCSTGQEAFSLAMLFSEAIAAAGSKRELQIFASDIDEDAIAQARTGLYPLSIEAELTPERLLRYFVTEGNQYRVRPELRQLVVFSVQDLLKDPPFSRLDMVSCRNLLIYFGAMAQAKVLSLFHFALNSEGVLLLGGAETPVHSDPSFAVLSKADRTYRRLEIATSAGPSQRVANFRTGAAASPVATDIDRSDGSARMAELCRRLVIGRFAPPTVLVSSHLECLYTIGDLDRYLRVPQGDPSRSILDLVRAPFAPTLRAVIHLALRDTAPAFLTVPNTSDEASATSTIIEAIAVKLDEAPLLLVSFLSRPVSTEDLADPSALDAATAAVTRELTATRSQLQSAIMDLDAAAAAQKLANDEALSIQEEYQSTNEELLTSKEELQSLNEELTALNTQLQETLEQQRSASSDLQNVLFSTNLATLFLDRKLQIRFFTPATKALFRLLPSDIGRPLADLKGVDDDPALLADARRVLETQATSEQEFKASDGSWYRRRIFPYISTDASISGVVITIANVTVQHLAVAAVELARREADRANLAKSRFLAAASHDLRQPLQTLSLLQGLLAKTVTGEGQQRLVARFDETLSAMSGMLNTLLDINQIEAGEVRPVRSEVPVDAVLSLIKEEFTYHALSKNLSLRVAMSTARVTSDPRLLEQILRNLVANALKYTTHGKVLVGCRRRGDVLRFEVWDTGVGIPKEDQALIFDEYHQLANDARERSKGMGLGLSIVQRLAVLLDHKITVLSVLGVGSMFAIDVPLVLRAKLPRRIDPEATISTRAGQAVRSCAILVVEDDPELRDLLVQVLTFDGHRVVASANGPDAIALARRDGFLPDVILVDYNLPGGMDGIETSRQLNRGRAEGAAAVVVLTGDISTHARESIEAGGASRLTKPVKIDLLREAISRALDAIRTQPAHERAAAAPPVRPAAGYAQPVIYIVDDDALLRESLCDVLEAEGRYVQAFSACEDFLNDFLPQRESCLILDAYLPGMKGLELLKALQTSGRSLPTIVITGRSDIETAVNAMKMGAFDFIEKPVSHHDLIECIDRALEKARGETRMAEGREDAVRHIRSLTARQREVMDLVLAGHPSKNIAADLGISQRTVENHRASMMRRTGAKSLPALARLAVAAALPPNEPEDSGQS